MTACKALWLRALSVIAAILAAFMKVDAMTGQPLMLTGTGFFGVPLGALRDAPLPPTDLPVKPAPQGEPKAVPDNDGDAAKKPEGVSDVPPLARALSSEICFQCGL